MFWTLQIQKSYLNDTINNISEVDRLTVQETIPLALIPIVCVIGIITNLLNIIVFLNPKMKDPSFKFMLTISFANFFINCFSVYGFIIYCDKCTLNRSYITMVILLHIAIANHLNTYFFLFNYKKGLQDNSKQLFIEQSYCL